LGHLYKPTSFHRDGIALHGSTNVPPPAAFQGCVCVTLAALVSTVSAKVTRRPAPSYWHRRPSAYGRLLPASRTSARWEWDGRARPHRIGW
jgi:hypothetical protein